MKYSSARAFMRLEDYQPRTTPAESPFRQFEVTCLKCGSYRLRLVSEYNEEARELSVVLFCPQCRQREIMPIN
jgi:hypothetical protein